MLALFLFFLSPLAVKQDQTPLRAGCDAADEALAVLPAGTPVEVRFRLSDGSDCFKITATLEGKAVTGYLPASALTGVEGFDRQRTSALSVDVARALAPMETETRKIVIRGGDASLGQAAQLLEANQPAKAFEILERAAPRHRADSNVLLLAGLAAYRSDQLRPALEYWKQSLDLTPNEALQRVYDKVRREAEADRSGEKLIGMHIALRYEGERVPAETARSIVATLDQEFTRISAELGCPAGERIVAIVQSRDAYLRGTGAAEWSGGQYDGRIHLALPATPRSLTHELVHACLTSLAGGSRLPAWLQEGLAQKLSGDVLPADEREQLRQLASSRAIPRLENLRQDWSRKSTVNARLAYGLALAAADALYEHYGNYGIRNIVGNPQVLQQVTPELDKRLGF